MSPVFNDKFDMLMNIKRQETSATGSNSNTSTAVASPTTSSAAPTPTPATTSAAPTTTSTPVSTPTTPTTTSTPVTSSTTVSSTSETPTSASSTVVSTTTSSTLATSTTPTSTALVTSTSAAAATSISASRSTSTTLPGVSISSRSTVSVSYVRTTSGSEVYTATVIVSPSESAAAAAATKKSFFQNTGAVVGVFVVVGVVAMILLVLIGTVFIRRRRAKQFDLDVQEAAREAARAQAPVDDDDDYAGTSYNTHGSKPMTTEQRGYGYGATGASGWDPYARGAAPGGYEMQHRRTSTGAGMAGFAAGDVFARNAAAEQPGYNQQGYNQGYGQTYGQGNNQGYAQQGYAQDGYNTGYGQGYGANQQTYNSSYSNTPSGYNNTSPQQGYALAQEQPGQDNRAPVHAQMMMPEGQRHSYNNVGAFRQSPSYGEAHPGEQVQYGHAETTDTSGQDSRYPAAPRMSEDPYGGYLPYDEPGPSTASQAPSSNPPAYVAGPSNAGATGDRKVGRQSSGRSHGTRYSQEDESDEEPTRRVLKVANE